MKHQTDDKSTWDPGPWQDEPDELDWVDQETGLSCHISRGPVGSLCGYVGVSQDHPAFGIDYDPVEYSADDYIHWWRRHITQWVQYRISDIVVHRGLTFASRRPRSRNGQDLWWFGFDCSHAGDLMPRHAALLTEIAARRSAGFAEIYRDIEYVKAECASLATQLKAIDDDKKRTGRKVGIGQPRPSAD